MQYTLPTSPLKEYLRELVRFNGVILTDNGIFANADLLETIIQAGYNVSVRELNDTLREIYREQLQ